MTGQASANVQRIRSLGSAGIKVEAIAAELGLCKAYVLVLAKQHHINLLCEPSKGARRRAEFRELAARGLNAHEIATEIGITLTRAYQLAHKLKIKLERKPYANAQREPQQRDMQMAALYRSGKTLAQIGEQFGITRERVRQLLTKHHGLRAGDGGASVVAAAKAEKVARRKNGRSLRKWGCSYEQYAEIRNLKKPTRAFASQKKNADRRGIAWEMNLWQWWCIWQQSGHWHERGRGQGYVMCRTGDEGPYSVDNVFIAPARHNSSEQKRKKSGLPIGVRRTKNGRYVAYRHFNGEKLCLGTHPTPELAHAAYLAAVPHSSAAALSAGSTGSDVSPCSAASEPVTFGNKNARQFLAAADSEIHVASKSSSSNFSA